MVRSPRHVALVTLLLLAAGPTADLRAQAEVLTWFVGGTAGVAWATHVGSMRLGGEGNSFCRSTDDATGVAPFVGATAGLLLPGGDVEIVSRIGYLTLDGDAFSDETDQRILLPGQQEPVDQRVVEFDTVTYRLAQVELMAGLRSVSVGPMTLLLSAGPTVGYVTEGTFTRRAYLFEPSDGRFILPTGNGEISPDGRTATFSDGEEIEGLSRLRVGMKGGVAVIARAGAVDVVPGFYFDQALTPGSSTYDWRVRALTAQVDVRIRLD